MVHELTVKYSCSSKDAAQGQSANLAESSVLCRACFDQGRNTMEGSLQGSWLTHLRITQRYMQPVIEAMLPPHSQLNYTLAAQQLVPHSAAPGGNSRQ
jgi:hypothetical protein